MMKHHMITISSNPNNILEVETYLKRMELADMLHADKFADILISLTEAVNNAIIHGNKSDETKNVTIYVNEVNNGISFCVVDEGHGFNHDFVPDPTCQENIECCGGRGVYIMKALSDEIIFNDNGCSVEMFFELNKTAV
jgi:serine/threonine-protein kinase RsbW